MTKPPTRRFFKIISTRSEAPPDNSLVTELAIEKFKNTLADIRTLCSGTTPSSCFVCYAWGHPDNLNWPQERRHEQWVDRLVEFLLLAGIEVHYDKHENMHSGRIRPFTDKIRTSDFVILICTPLLVEKYTDTRRHYVVQDELPLVAERFKNNDRAVLPVLLDGAPETAIPAFLPKDDSVFTDFRPFLNCYQIARERDDYYSLCLGMIAQLHRVKEHRETERAFQLAVETFHHELSIIRTDSRPSVKAVDHYLQTVSLDTPAPTPPSPRSIWRFLTLGKSRPDTGFIPQYDHEFVGRRDAEAKLLQLLKKPVKEKTIVIPVTGPSGIGKTHFVSHMIRSHILTNSRYHFAGWLKGDEKEIMSTIMSSANQTKPWVAVIDDMLDPGTLFGQLPQGGYLIITSQNELWETDTIALGPLQTQESISLLKTTMKTRRFTNHELNQLSHALNDYPLGLLQAARFLDAQTDYSLTGYCNELQSDHLRLLDESAPPGNRPLRVTVLLIVKKVEEESPLAHQLLQRLCYCGATYLPKNFIYLLTKSILTRKLDPAEHKRRTREAIEVLRKYSLISVSGDYFMMHGLIQQVLQHHIKKDTQSKPWISEFVKNLLGDTGEKKYIGEVLQVTDELFRTTPAYKEEISNKPDHFFVHGMQILDHAFRYQLLPSASLQTLIAKRFYALYLTQTYPDANTIIAHCRWLVSDKSTPLPVSSLEGTPLFIAEELFYLISGQKPLTTARCCLGIIQIMSARLSQTRTLPNSDRYPVHMSLARAYYKLSTALSAPNGVLSGNPDVMDATLIIDALHDLGTTHFNHIAEPLLHRFRKLAKTVATSDYPGFEKREEFSKLLYLLAQRIAGKNRTRLDIIFKNLPHPFFKHLKNTLIEGKWYWPDQGNESFWSGFVKTLPASFRHDLGIGTRSTVLSYSARRTLAPLFFLVAAYGMDHSYFLGPKVPDYILTLHETPPRQLRLTPSQFCLYVAATKINITNLPPGFCHRLWWLGIANALVIPGTIAAIFLLPIIQSSDREKQGKWSIEQLDTEINLLHNQLIRELRSPSHYEDWIAPIAWSLRDSLGYTLRQALKEGVLFLIPLVLIRGSSDPGATLFLLYYLLSLFKTGFVNLLGRKPYDLLRNLTWYLAIAAVFLTERND